MLASEHMVLSQGLTCNFTVDLVTKMRHFTFPKGHACTHTNTQDTHTYRMV